MKILIIHGPNLNLLGVRKPEIYGKETLFRLNAKIRTHAKKKNASVRIFQRNGEGGILDIISKEYKTSDFLIINPGAYAHYSYAVRDAIEAADIPAVEVHLTDIKKREAFRRKSVISPVCLKSFSGFGHNSYLKAIDFCVSEKDR